MPVDMREKLSRYISDKIARYLIYASGTISFLILIAIGIFVLKKGCRHLKKLVLGRFFLALSGVPLTDYLAFCR